MDIEIPTVNGHGVIRGAPDNPVELTELIAAVQMHFSGKVTVSESLIKTILTDPHTDLATDHLHVRHPDSGQLIAWAQFENPEPHIHSRAKVYVHPNAMGLGIGTALTVWGLDRARGEVRLAPDGVRVANGCAPVSRNDAATELLKDNGYMPDRHYLEMTTALAVGTAVSPIPSGIQIRTITHGDSTEILADVQHESFRDHYGWVDEPREIRYEEWGHWRASDLWENELVWLAEHGGDVVATLTALDSYGPDKETGYVAVLGVLPDHRGRGLAKALLTTAFCEFERRGKQKVALHVDADSITGATRLYEGVGMVETDRETSYEIEIRPGDDVVVR